MRFRVVLVALLMVSGLAVAAPPASSEQVFRSLVDACFDSHFQFHRGTQDGFHDQWLQRLNDKVRMRQASSRCG